MRQFAARAKRPRLGAIAESRSFPAPYRGLNARDPEALMQPGWATVLENWFPTGTDVQVRKGAADHVTGFSQAVRTLMDWTGKAGTSKLFAACNNGIFDATTAGTVGSSVSTITNGWCNYCNYETSGNSYLVVVNGTDDFRTFDGTTWTTTATFTVGAGPGTIDTNTLINVIAHQRRLWFVVKDSIDAYYFDVNTAAGPVTLFPLGAYFTRGGHLLAIGTWTVDGGDGPEDFVAFISSKGQVAVYAGTDPGAAATWILRGVYDMPEPLGYRCALKYGGDCLLATRGGIFPLTELLKGRPVSSSLAISNVIHPLISADTLLHGAKRGWQMEHLLDENLLLFNVPTTEGSTSRQYAMNITTKAWAKFTGWDALCIERHKNALYIGMADKVAKVWTGVSDFTGVITAQARGHFDYFGEPGRLKQWRSIRPIIKAPGALSIGVALDTDFNFQTSFGPTSFTPGDASVWDTALWDSAMWASSFTVRHDLIGLEAYPGYSAALRLRVVTNNTTVAWSATTFFYELGALFG